MYKSASELYSDVQKYMDRNESSIVNKIPLWVHLAEDELDRRLRHPACQLSALITVYNGTDYIPAPSNMLELSWLKRKESNTVLKRLFFETLHSLPNYEKYPVAFAAKANKYVLDKPVQEDTVFEILYYVEPTKLTQSSTNMYLQIAADYLLFSALAHGFSYDTNLDEAAYYRTLAENSFASLENQITKEAYAGSTMFQFNDNSFIERYF